MTREDTISEEQEDLNIEDLELPVLEHIEFEFGDNVVYPHHGAGKVLKKEAKTMFGQERDVPDHQDPPQRHDRDGPVGERRRRPVCAA